MIRIVAAKNGEISTVADLQKFLQIIPKELLWIDLLSPSSEERDAVEKLLQIHLQSRQESKEIESSSRFIELDGQIIANSNFLLRINGSYQSEPISFVLKNALLITYRNAELRSFDENFRKLHHSQHGLKNGYHIFVSLLETRIDLDADLLEAIAQDISAISKKLAVNKNTDEDMLLRINSFQETTMLLRENIIDKQRVLSAVLRSEQFPKDNYDKVRIMLKDIGSLLDHTVFNFERLEYLQNTFLGLVDIEQNRVIKIFTFVAVIFMPPTLIASIYGMNFRLMPELDQTFGYPLAILLMILSSVLTRFYFKRRKWL